jgi:hypothetical protein
VQRVHHDCQSPGAGEGVPVFRPAALSPLDPVPRWLRSLSVLRVAGMEPDRLSSFPFVIVRIGCSLCGRNGAYRLARLAAKYGPEIPLDQLLERLAVDCPWRRGRRRQASGKDDPECRARFVDLDGPPRPPDLPPSFQGLRVIAGGKG